MMEVYSNPMQPLAPNWRRHNQPPPPSRFSRPRYLERKKVIVKPQSVPTIIEPTAAPLPLVPTDSETKKRKAEVESEPEEPVATVETKRAKLLAEQRNIYKMLRKAETGIEQFDTIDFARYEHPWSDFYDRITVQASRVLAIMPMSSSEAEWLKSRIKNTEDEHVAAMWHEAQINIECCTARLHVMVTERNDATQFNTTPNAVFYSKDNEALETGCVCPLKGAILMCNDLSHTHSRCGWQTQINETHTDATNSFSFERRVESIDRYRDRLTFGSFNQNIVATNVFGEATRQVWDTLLRIACQFPTPPHSVALFNELDAELHADTTLTATRHCIDSFCYKTWQEARRGKAADRRMALLPTTIYFLKQKTRKNEYFEPRTVRDAGYLDANHPYYWRFDATDANETTLGLLLFVEATGNSIWLDVWKRWCTLLCRHCWECRLCQTRLCEFLSSLVLLFELTPGVVATSYSSRLEQLLRRVKIKPTN
jgi:hypothetical protein